MEKIIRKSSEIKKLLFFYALNYSKNKLNVKNITKIDKETEKILSEF